MDTIWSRVSYRVVAPTKPQKSLYSPSTIREIDQRCHRGKDSPRAPLYAPHDGSAVPARQTVRIYHCGQVSRLRKHQNKPAQPPHSSSRSGSVETSDKDYRKENKRHMERRQRCQEQTNEDSTSGYQCQRIKPSKRGPTKAQWHSPQQRATQISELNCNKKGHCATVLATPALKVKAGKLAILDQRDPHQTVGSSPEGSGQTQEALVDFFFFFF